MTPPPSRPPDRILISSLELHLPYGLGPSAFGLVPAPPCPALLSLEIELDDAVVPSCTSDDTMGGLGINYSSTSKALIALCQGRAWSGPEELVRAASTVPLELDVVRSVRVEVELPKALLPARAAVYSAVFARDQGRSRDLEGGSGDVGVEGGEWRCEVKDLRVRTIIGLHPHERLSRQWLEVDVGVEGYAAGWDHRLFAEGVYGWLDKSEYRTIEALIDALAKHILTDASFGGMLTDDSELSITLRKPSALAFACPTIAIRRTQADYRSAGDAALAHAPSAAAIAAALPSDLDRFSPAHAGPSSTLPPARVFVAIGSNIGDRIGHLRRAVDHVAGQDGLELVSTSRLYESEPMYVEDQDRFINGVIELKSTLTPLDVLRVLKRTEKLIGRTKTFRNGPRVVDLDLLAYGGEKVQIGRVDDPEDEDGIGWLECPHPRIGEREFVLRPWADLAPEIVMPGTSSPISSLLATLMQAAAPSLAPIISFPHPALPLRLEGAPRLMQIFNATPDSFSDGHSDNLDVKLALKSITALFDPSTSPGQPTPPDILDIGGMSTRPGSVPCTEQEELDRVVPLIRAIRSSDNAQISSLPISVDTYRANVARAAVEAGASCINDVRGGSEPGMTRAMAEAGVPVVLMHSRGDSHTMGTPELQDYSAQGGVVAGVRRELGARVRDALDAGVKRWDVILDPGLGFAKTQEDNLALLRRVGELNAPPAPGGHLAEHVLAGLPVLVGGSRKGFVGRAIGRAGKDEASARGYGDAAVVAWCAARSAPGKTGGVDVLRVHDARAMGEVLSMWRAIEEA